MNRKEKILQHIDKNGFGIEIGPSHNPVAPKKEGYKVHIIDHLDQKCLIAKYKDQSMPKKLLARAKSSMSSIRFFFITHRK